MQHCGCQLPLNFKEEKNKNKKLLGKATTLIRKSVRDSWQKRWDTDGKGRHCCNIQRSIDMKVFKGK